MKMKIYTIKRHVTVHDIASEVGYSRQSVAKWLLELEIPTIQVLQGKHVFCTFVPTSALAKLRRRAAKARTWGGAA